MSASDSHEQPNQAQSRHLHGQSPINWEPPAPRNVAVVHDWLVEIAGAEKVLEQILALFPDATLYTLIDQLPAEHRTRLPFRRTVTSNLNRLPAVRKYFTKLLPWMPQAIQQFDLSEHDLVISSSHCVAKGVVTSPNTLHLCYCHSPMRYAWDLQALTLQTEQLDHGFRSWLAQRWMHQLRTWDASHSHGPEAIAANSYFVQRRIRKCWGRDSTVIPPPVNTKPPEGDFKRNPRQLLSAGRLVGHKNTEILVKAMRHLSDYHLIVVGEGPQIHQLQRLSPPNVEFLGWVSDKKLSQIRAESAAFLFAAVEDFGIAPIEALSAGLPVVALACGGVLDYLQHRENAWLYDTLSPESVATAVLELTAEADPGLSSRCVASASQFAEEQFAKRFSSWVQGHWLAWSQLRNRNFNSNLGKATTESKG